MDADRRSDSLATDNAELAARAEAAERRLESLTRENAELKARLAAAEASAAAGAEAQQQFNSEVLQQLDKAQRRARECIGGVQRRTSEADNREVLWAARLRSLLARMAAQERQLIALARREPADL